MGQRWTRRAVAVLGLVWLTGCATYSERLLEARQDTNAGSYDAAISNLNDFLGVGSDDEVPTSWKSDRPLAALERGVLLQATDRYADSARTFSAAEGELELLDLSPDAIGEIGSYIYSDSARKYKAPPTEKLSLNAFNMLNYLALGDLGGAGVEARRFTTTRDYLQSIGIDKTGRLGSYLAGFTFEYSGEGDRALRYYDEALAGGRLASLEAPVRRLAAANPYRGPRVKALLQEVGGPIDAARPSEVLVVVSLGRVPYKVPERMPIGAAVGIAGTFITGNTAILERSIFKVVVYPDLTSSDTLASGAEVSIDGRTVPVELLDRLGKDIRQEYEKIKPRIIGAALTRMIARAAAAEGARVAGQQAGNAGALVGLLAALATEGTLVALDKPDTRSWTFLPNQIFVARHPVQPGQREVRVTVRGLGETRTLRLDVPEGGFGVAVVTVPR
jgi:hypothetical protein